MLLLRTQLEFAAMAVKQRDKAMTLAFLRDALATANRLKANDYKSRIMRAMNFARVMP